MLPKNRDELIKLSTEIWLNVENITPSDAFNMLLWLMEKEDIYVSHLLSDIDKIGANDSHLPKRMNVHIGSCLGTSYQIEVKDEKIIYREFDSYQHEDAVDNTHVLYADKQLWDEFWNSLDKIKIWDWKSDYSNPDIVDGGYWYINIIYDTKKKIFSSGGNAYPDNFIEFIHAIRKLIKGKKFSNSPL